MLTEKSGAGVTALSVPQWTHSLSHLCFAVETEQGGRNGHQAQQAHSVAGAGKLLFALSISELGTREPGLLPESLPVTRTHRRRAHTGTLRLLSGEMNLSVDDAVRLLLSTGDGACALALNDFLEQRQIDILSHVCELTDRLSLASTRVTGIEGPDASWGEGLAGTTTVQDLLRLLRHLSAPLRDDPLGVSDTNVGVISTECAQRVLGWMRKVFEPAGLASALPGHGPHRVPNWTTSSWEILPKGTVEGCHSVLITNSAEAGWICAAAYHPGREGNSDAALNQDITAALGTLGLSAYLNKRE